MLHIVPLLLASSPLLAPTQRTRPLPPEPVPTQESGAQRRRELRAILQQIEAAAENLNRARRMLLDHAIGSPETDQPPVVDDPPVITDPPVDPPRGRDWDAVAFEAYMKGVDRSGWLTIPPQGGGQYSMQIQNARPYTRAAGTSIERRRFLMGKAGILGGTNRTVDTSRLIRGLELYDCEFTASPSYNGASYWGMRVYNVTDMLLDSIYWHDFGQRSEHGAYVNLVGDFTARNLYAYNLGGQMLQLTNREEVGANRDIPDSGENHATFGGDILVERFVARNCGTSEARGSFPISIKNVGRPGRTYDVTIRDGLITGNFPEQLRSGRSISSTGGILVNGFGRNAWHYGTVLIENVVIDLTRTSHPVLQINNCERLIVRNCTFKVTAGVYGDAMIDRTDPSSYASALRTGTIIWENNTGNVRLRVGGEVIGPVDQDYTRLPAGSVEPMDR